MPSPKVILLNADLSSAAGPQLLQGFSGKTYAVSRWNPQHHCHAIEMSLAEYEACRDDLRRAVHLMMRRWYPKFVLPERPAAVEDFEKGYEAGSQGAELPGDARPAARVGWEMGIGLEPAEWQDSTPAPATREKAAPRRKRKATRASAEVVPAEAGVGTEKE